MSWVSPRTWVTGQIVTAAQMNEIRDSLKAIGDPWSSYAIAWTASTTNPTLGNGSITGFYVAAGKTIIAGGKLTVGSTSTFGTGVYIFSSPTTINTPSLVGIGGADFFDSSTALHYAHNPYVSSGGGTAVSFAATAARWTTTAPVAPATSDTMGALWVYEST